MVVMRDVMVVKGIVEPATPLHAVNKILNFESDPVLFDYVLDPRLLALARALVDEPSDGALHAIGFAPPVCLGGDFMAAGWEDVSVSLEVSAYSLKALADVAAPLMPAGGSLVALDFDATVAWPVYDWMGVAKAALESVARYLARDLGPRGIRVNLVAAGPVGTVAARSIPGFAAFEEAWSERAPLGWDVNDADPVARACVLLLSDWLAATTGEILHVDGGYHAMGA